MPGAFAKTKKATNILRPDIDVSFLGAAEEFLGGASKKNRKKLFSPYKIIDSENFIKVSQNPNKVARDTQGLPTCKRAKWQKSEVQSFCEASRPASP